MELNLEFPSARVLRRLLDDPSRPRFIQELARETGLTAGTLHPMMTRMERAGVVTGLRERGDPHELKRRLRVYYKLTGTGERYAREELARLADELRPPAGDAVA
jgi:DNA-binding MarR family transcriptional regulator